MIRSSFASFTTARLAIQASQSALGIVGQNMANVKTDGYTRQRLDLVSINQRGISSAYSAIPTAHIGSGVMVTGVSQIRDPFLDTRYRLEMGSLGSADMRNEILGKIGTVLDETGRSALDDQFGDFGSQLTKMSENASGDSNDSMVRSSAQTLVGMFRQYSKQLTDVKDYLIDNTEQDIGDANAILNQIKDLNISIKNSQVHGNPALELQDDRNLLIDQLSTYMNISVTHTTDVTMTGAAVDVLRIDLIGNSNKGAASVNLIDDVKDPAQLSFTKPAPGSGDEYGISVTDTFGVPYKDVISDKGTFETSLGMLNDAGEFDTPPNSNRGIGYYQGALDQLASVFATKFNELNSVPRKDGTVDPSRGALFSTNNKETKITAGNITISDGWQNGTIKVLRSQLDTPATDDNSNLMNMIKELTNKQDFKTPGGGISFSGSFQNCYTNIVDSQAMDQKSTQIILKNHISIANEISSSKDSVSGVNLDEEGMNMLQYNTSLTAASRLMTALDEALNTIINSMGVVGR